MKCNPVISAHEGETSELDLVDKYQKLMQATLAEDSLYERAKSTFHVLFDDLQLTEAEKATIVAQNITNMTTQMSATAMATALSWSKEERDGGYTLAKVKAETEILLANAEKVKLEICDVQASTELKYAQITATLSGSIRENGRVDTWDPDDVFVPLKLKDEGLKYQQTKMVMGQTYQIYSDAFRKSGVITIEDDTDGYTKGMAPKVDAQSVEAFPGHTYAQTGFTNRQTLSFEDSKRNHAANAASQMVGQLLASESFSDTNGQDITRWRASVDYLNDCTPEQCVTSIPFSCAPGNKIGDDNRTCVPK